MKTCLSRETKKILIFLCAALCHVSPRAIKLKIKVAQGWNCVSLEFSICERISDNVYLSSREWHLAISHGSPWWTVAVCKQGQDRSKKQERTAAGRGSDDGGRLRRGEPEVVPPSGAVQRGVLLIGGAPRGGNLVIS